MTSQPASEQQSKVMVGAQAMPDHGGVKSVRLILSLSEDGALQQALHLADGKLIVGETIAPALPEPNHSATSHVLPWAPKVAAALQRLSAPVTLECQSQISEWPWAAWIKAINPMAVPHIADLNAALQRSHRYVTSLSYDLIDSTGLMTTLGSESYALVLADFHQKFTEIAHGWQAVIQPPNGSDGSMCYFGLSATEGHIAKSAMLCALQMRDMARHRGWSVRIGVARGDVAVDIHQHVGPTVHLAARLQKNAAIGSVLVSKELSEHYKTDFLYKEYPLKEKIPGFEELTDLIELVAVATKSTQPAQILVGRQRELAVIHSAWEQAQAGKASDILIKGSAGMGKTALIDYWRANADAVCYVIRCEPQDYRHAFSSLKRWINLVLGFVAGDSREISRTRLEVCIRQHQEWKSKLATLEYVLDVFDDKQPSLFQDQAARHEQVIQDIKNWIVERLQENALTIVVEDHQWMDASSQAWLEQVRQTTLPNSKILLLVTQRTGAEQSYSHPQHNITLSPLDVEQSVQIIHALSPGIGEYGELASLIAQRAQGVPLFLQESIRLYSSTNYKDQLQKSMRLGSALPVPNNLQELLMQRMDQLGTARELAQIASVLGQEFPKQLLEDVSRDVSGRLSDGDVFKQMLEQLAQEGMLTSLADTGQSYLRFSHALLCDAAYHSIWESDRKRIHSIAAKYIQAYQLVSDHSHVTDLARHLAAAGQVQDAIAHLTKIGKSSKKRGAHSVATQTLQTAHDLLNLMVDGSDRRRKEIEIQLLLAGQKIITQGYGSSSVEQHFQEACQLGEQLNDSKEILRAQLGLQNYYFMRGDFEKSWRYLGLAKATAHQVNNALSQLHCDWAKANLLFYEGKMKECELLMKSCISLCEQNDFGEGLLQNPRVLAIMYRAFSMWCLGQEGQALQLAKQGQNLAMQSPHRLTRLQAHGIAAMVQYACGNWKPALDCAIEAMASCQPGEYALWYAHAGVMQGAALARLGQLDHGLELVRKHHEDWAEHGGALTRSYYWAIEAELLLETDQPKRALEKLGFAINFLKQFPERYYISEIKRLSLCAQRQINTSTAEAQRYTQSLVDLYEQTQREGLHGLAQRVMDSIQDASEINSPQTRVQMMSSLDSTEKVTNVHLFKYRR